MPDNSKKEPVAVRSQAPATSPKADILSKIVDKINASDSILVALSDAPSVDELAAAVGLTMLLDRISKHATAIFSGEIPNALEFLKPEETLEKNTDSLRDFIIALNKEKADHIRYMIEGDFVRIYITPYRTTLGEKDLEFSYGDYNVDLVIAIDVKNSEDLDDALSEYGRIMHDAVTINITNSEPGRFADLEWSMPEASSVCEMIIDLAERLGVTDFDQDIATAFLTGIVSATERFSNSHTTPGSLTIASKLMSAGADQQLIASNIMKKTGDAGSDSASEDKPVDKQVSSVVEEKPKEVPVEATRVEPAAEAKMDSTAEASTNPGAEVEPKEDLIPTPASVKLPQADPVSIPSLITQTTAPVQTEVASSTQTVAPVQVEAGSATQVAPFQTEINPATQAAPNLPTPDIISLPQISYEQSQVPTQPLEQQIKPMIQPVEQSSVQPLVQPVAQSEPQPVAQSVVQPVVQPVVRPISKPVESVAPAGPPDYGAMIDAELAEANKPKPEPAPLPPLPMPPAPQPFAEQSIPATPVAPTPTATTPVTSVTPIASTTPIAPASAEPVVPAGPTTTPAPSTPSTTVKGSAFQIPNL